MTGTLETGGTAKTTAANYDRVWDKLWVPTLAQVAPGVDPAFPTSATLAEVIVALDPDQTTAADVNMLRSAVSKLEFGTRPLARQTGDTIGANAAISSLIKKLYPLARKPKYDTIFDLGPLIRKAAKWMEGVSAGMAATGGVPSHWPLGAGEFDDLRLKASTFYETPDSRKRARFWVACYLVFFIAFTLRRFRDATRVRVEELVVDDDGVTVVFDSTKTENRTAVRVTGSVTPTVDFVTMTRIYLALTLQRRDGPSGPMFVALSPKANTKSPDGALASSTLSNYVKEVLTEAEVDADYGPYAIRHATVSFLADNGVSEDAIRRLGGWTNDAVFRKFYQRARKARSAVSHVLENAMDASTEEDAHAGAAASHDASAAMPHDAPLLPRRSSRIAAAVGGDNN